MQMQMGMGAGPNMSFDAPKAFKQERVSMRLHSHEWALEHAEKKLLGEPLPVKAKPAAAPVSSASVSSSSSQEKRGNAKFQKLSKKR